jgi:hypothetical protein
MSSLLSAAAREIREAMARSRPQANYAALAIGIIALAVGPLALTLLRADDYSSTTRISLASWKPSTDSGKLHRIDTLLRGPLELGYMQREVARKVGWLTAGDLPEKVAVQAIRERGRPVFLLTARAPTAEQARELAELVGTRLIMSSESALKFIQTAALERTRQALRMGDRSEARRRTLTRRRDALASEVEAEEPVFVPRPSEPTLAKERLGDRVLGALPGDTPPKPNPVWATVAGIALAVALGLWALVLSSASRVSATRSPG